MLRNEPGLFGRVASPATCWRVLAGVDGAVLDGLKRARVRERAWLVRAEAGRPVPAVRCAGRGVPGLVIDVDATLVTCHSAKQGAAATFEHGFGYIRCWPAWTTPKQPCRPPSPTSLDLQTRCSEDLRRPRRVAAAVVG